MLKTVFIAIIAAFPLLFNAGDVRAKAMMVDRIQCPVGTCGGGGGGHARDVKYCKASNCGQGRSAPK
jgi:hypothetical protein